MQYILKDKIALVLGSSGGLGQSIAKKYIDLGAHVISVGRNLSALEEVDDYAQSKNSSTTIVQLDLKDPQKIKSLAQEIHSRFRKIDIMISLAAILGEVTPIQYYNERIWQKVIDTNFTANFHLIKSMHPLLEKSDKPIALFATGRMSEKNNAYWGAYSASKAALEDLIKTYSEETVSTNIRVNLVDPGPIATRLRCAAFPGKNKKDFTKPEDIADLFVTSITRSNIISGEVISYKTFAT
ncbi:MAG: SDR family NAD(P)-dependent oxidoreductase [Alphaproteobacteria bacterium]|nr:SDR family NAD(P)-dependent oxidoreductase [Alphaproteobacteria bacterium]